MTFIQKTFKKIGTQKDLALEMADSYRLLLLAKARWFVVGLLIVHWIISFSTFVIASNYGKTPLTIGHIYQEALGLAFYPFLVMFGAIGLNAFFHIGWYKLQSLWSNNASNFISIQIVLDIIMVLALIHFTGGVTSWLWPLFLIINLEIIYLFSSNRRIIVTGLMAGIGYTILAILEYNGILATYQMPYLPQNLQFNLVLVTLILIWVNLICGFSLLISLYLRRGEQREISEKIIRDGLTHLYNRKYFIDRLNTEVQRSRMFNRVFSLILLEIDNYDEYLKTAGQGQTDELLRWVGEVLRMNVRRSEVEPLYEFDIAAHVEDSKFAILLPETGAEQKRDVRDMLSDAEVFGAAAFTVAKRIKSTIKSSKFTYGTGVTVSISIVSYPIDGSNTEEILISANNGLARAKEAGDKVIVVSQKTAPEVLSTN